MDFDDQVDWDEIDYWSGRCGECDQKCGGICGAYVNQADTFKCGWCETPRRATDPDDLCREHTTEYLAPWRPSPDGSDQS